MVPPKHKHKWTKGEESALLAGVRKYGIGKWRAIQDDDQFGPRLTSRSNVDLKDKWRNLLTKSKTGISNEGDPLPLAGWSGPLEEEFAITPMASLPLKRGSHKRRTPVRRQIRGGSGSMEGKGPLTPLAPLSVGEGIHQGKACKKASEEAEFAVAEAVEADTAASIKASQKALQQRKRQMQKQMKWKLLC